MIRWQHLDWPRTDGTSGRVRSCFGRNENSYGPGLNFGVVGQSTTNAKHFATVVGPGGAQLRVD
jgi:hypothetical protein